MILLFAGYFLFAFCTVDFLHAADCEGDETGPAGHGDGCAACLFELGAHTELPTFLVVPDVELWIKQILDVFTEQVTAVASPTQLRLRAPPL